MQTKLIVRKAPYPPYPLTPQAVLRWEEGLDHPPTLYLLAASDEQQKVIELILEPLFASEGEADGR